MLVSSFSFKQLIKIPGKSFGPVVKHLFPASSGRFLTAAHPLAHTAREEDSIQSVCKKVSIGSTSDERNQPVLRHLFCLETLNHGYFCTV